MRQAREALPWLGLALRIAGAAVWLIAGAPRCPRYRAFERLWSDTAFSRTFSQPRLPTFCLFSRSESAFTWRQGSSSAGLPLWERCFLRSSSLRKPRHGFAGLPSTAAASARFPAPRSARRPFFVTFSLVFRRFSCSPCQRESFPSTGACSAQRTFCRMGRNEGHGWRARACIPDRFSRLFHGRSLNSFPLRFQRLGSAAQGGRFMARTAKRLLLLFLVLGASAGFVSAQDAPSRSRQQATGRSTSPMPRA